MPRVAGGFAPKAPVGDFRLPSIKGTMSTQQGFGLIWQEIWRVRNRSLRKGLSPHRRT